MAAILITRNNVPWTKLHLNPGRKLYVSVFSCAFISRSLFLDQYSLTVRISTVETIVLV